GLTVPDLKEKCKAAGLKVGGKKSELIARLVEHEAGGEEESDPLMAALSRMSTREEVRS
ncbi:hypothetical protein T484DRAFT_1778139, partial [Baffinella frigidus]